MNKRLDILKQKENILIWVKDGLSKSIICKKLKCKPETFNNYLSKLEIKYSGSRGRKGIRIPIVEYLENRLLIKSNELKLKLYKEKLKEEQCEKCNIINWCTEAIVFELHHIDGDIHNNNLINLMILCPNCHSQTKDFRKKKQI